MRKDGSMRSGDVLQCQRHTQAAANAQGRNATFGLALEHLTQQRDRDARSGATDRMAERDRAAIDIQFLRIEMQFPVAGQDLGGEGFVELYQVEIGYAELMLLLHLAQRRYWSNAHDARIHARGSYGQNAGEWFEVVFPGEVFAREHDCGGAIRDAGRIGRRDSSGFREDRREFGHLLHRGSQKKMLVATEGLLTFLAFKSDGR